MSNVAFSLLSNIISSTWKIHSGTGSKPLKERKYSIISSALRDRWMSPQPPQRIMSAYDKTFRQRQDRHRYEVGVGDDKARNSIETNTHMYFPPTSLLLHCGSPYHYQVRTHISMGPSSNHTQRIPFPEHVERELRRDLFVIAWQARDSWSIRVWDGRMLKGATKMVRLTPVCHSQLLRAISIHYVSGQRSLDEKC